VSVAELWDKRLGISEVGKRYRLEIFFKAFDEFLDGKEEAYYYYLLSHRSKKPKTPTERDIRHVKRKMADAKKLYKDISKNGLMAPLEFYRRGGKLFLLRGYRRLVIIHKLGIEKTSIRMLVNENVGKKLHGSFTWKPGSISEVGAKQFAKYGGLATDKWWVHNYLTIYDSILYPWRGKRIKILEIGLLHGASLRLWHQAFPKAQIFGFDKTEKFKRMTRDLKRLKVVVGDEDNPADIERVARLGDFHVIIDDCGHMPEQQWSAFCGLWPKLRPGGYYIIEDTYRSFNPKYEGRNVPQEFAGWLPSIYNKGFEVKSLQFHYNLCIVQKGLKA
jgi:hypothetical protein